MMSAPIPVGISACLLGAPVRFDGGHKRFALDQLAPYCHFQQVCHEMAVGLPVPRPALQLVNAGKQGIRLCASNGSGIDVTDEMLAFSEGFVE